MAAVSKHDPDIYKGTAWYYSRFRPRYPETLVALLRDTFKLDGRGRLLDLGCGPGTVAIRLANLFERVMAIDPEPEMLAEGRAEAARASISNIEWRPGSSEDLSAELGSFRLITMGNSFHWMDRDRTLDTLYDLVMDGGGIAVVGEGAPLSPPPPTPWRVAVNEVVRKYVGDRPLPWDATSPHPEELHEGYIQRSRFKDLSSYVEPFEVTWTVESMIGNLYSMSFCSRRILGDRVDAFERDLRAAILAVEPSGVLRGEPPEFFAYLAWKR
jgi:ubiquinone/menaquinone biosynthesis C-methylase UbiE